jgi:hypothetical protein
MQAWIPTTMHGSGQVTQVSLHCMLYVAFASKNKGIYHYQIYFII